MADPSAEPQQASAPAGSPWLFAIPRERPKVVVKADLLPAVSVLSMISLLGIPLGWLWSMLAPPERVRVVAATGPPVPLQLESWHRFDAMVIYVLLGLSAGLVTGAVVWLMRERRGPVVLFAMVAGSALAGWLGTMMATAFANGRYEVTAPPALGAVLEQAPEVGTLWVLLAQPLAAALVYGLLAAWNGRDDLGRRLG
ncbi:DUF2567 domain-containing protein [Amycolatopsis nigrescens]|uniref:DUF2567 domain-containing protein n=1 Tax=Amycolatopsis nigrescens TaxID=381445 RepID=UPI000381094B|nr:DUF2567 domain-containing protein [Amycolatopsis nigrescens]